MVIDLEHLPTEHIILHQIIFNLVSEVNSLQDQLLLLKAKYFGKSSEKINKQIADLEMRIEEEESESIADVAQGSDEDEKYKDSKQQPKRNALSDHLPREDIIINHDPKCSICGSEQFRKICDDISETLEYIPSSFKVVRHIRPRCICIDCDHIMQANLPSKGIDKGKAGPGLLAHILVQKYCNHLPLYRQSQIYEREGIDLSRTTMAGWASACSKLLEPLVREITKYVFASPQIHTDDTPVKVLAPGIGKTKTGRIWAYIKDGRPHGDESPTAICYFYSPDRREERPVQHLKDYTGIMHADAYAGYNNLYISDKNKDATIEEAACWAHTRRKFYEITITNDKASIALTVLDAISKLYKIEAEIRGLDPDQRLDQRQSRSKELVNNLFKYFQKTYALLPRKSSTAKAIYYALGNQEALKRFLDNGRVEIDNNTAERAMRSIAVGRKNWLFAGSDRGGETAAGIYSLIESAKINNINPHKYFKKVLETIQDYNSQKLADLLPWNIILD